MIKLTEEKVLRKTVNSVEYRSLVKRELKVGK